MCFASSVQLAYFLLWNVHFVECSFCPSDRCLNVGCKCRKNDQLALDNNCLIASIICKANVATDRQHRKELRRPQ